MSARYNMLARHNMFQQGEEEQDTSLGALFTHLTKKYAKSEQQNMPAAKAKSAPGRHTPF